ncbi:MAG: 16S rRNA (uracil(1498)-N(3))-methyltransferase [Chitinophagaceae bacterium]|nr:16S rRNA (uracil(1498)-N(3))-methyltransferase [Chitinophagaceae bacterium]
MNALPLFYFPALAPSAAVIDLDDTVRHHAVTVLRMSEGEKMLLTNGKGLSATATIISSTKKQLTVQLHDFIEHPDVSRKMILGISLLKNAARFEWMLEKVTEIGITEIYPLRCERTEKQHYKKERFEQIIISACLQSQQFHFPVLHEPIALSEMLNHSLPNQKYIAHCMEGDKQLLSHPSGDAALLVGPEGDFTTQEINDALAQQFIPVSLGNTRLRTETAGVVGAVLLR